jgi:ATP-binding cassette, subfamily C, bacterial
MPGDRALRVIDTGVESIRAMTKSLLRRYAHDLIKITGYRLAAALGLAVLFSLTEGIGIALLLPTLEVAGLDLTHQGKAGTYAKLAADGLARAGIPPSLPILLGLLVLLIAGRSMLGSVEMVATSSVCENFAATLRRRLYGAIVNADWLFIARKRSSDLTHALTAEIERVGAGTHQAMLLAGNAILILLYVGVAFTLSASMTLLVLAAGALLALALGGRTRMLRDAGATISAATRRLYAAAIEHLQSLKATRAYGAQDRNFELFSRLNREVVGTTVEIVRQEVVANSYFEIGSIAVLGAVLYVSIEVLSVPPVEILILLLLFSRVMPRLRSAHGHYQAFVASQPSFANVLTLESQCRLAPDPSRSSNRRFEVHAAVRLEHVTFSYEDAGAAAVRGVSLLIPAGRITAIVGPSGAGKSTIADLVMGLLRPRSGTVTIDGELLTPEVAGAWRERLGYVSHDTFLFHDTIRANLAWAHPHASEAEMLEALRLAAADQFVAALPDGLDTLVGDRGATLSQGERQRLALSRALLRRPSMLVLDEATNNLDSENENRVLAAIDHLRGKLTTLLIAHRLSTIRWADLIYVVEDGRVVESGDWAALSARQSGRFRALCEAQSLVV